MINILKLTPKKYLSKMTYHKEYLLKLAYQ